MCIIGQRSQRAIIDFLSSCEMCVICCAQCKWTAHRWERLKYLFNQSKFYLPPEHQIRDVTVSFDDQLMFTMFYIAKKITKNIEGKAKSHRKCSRFESSEKQFWGLFFCVWMFAYHLFHCLIPTLPQ